MTGEEVGAVVLVPQDSFTSTRTPGLEMDVVRWEASLASAFTTTLQGEHYTDSSGKPDF